MSYLERFIRGCFVREKYGPKSFLIAIGCYSASILFMLIIVLMNPNTYSFIYYGSRIFIGLALFILCMNIFGLLVKFRVESDWPLWIMYVTGIVSLYMVVFFTTLVFEGSMEELIVAFLLLTASAFFGFAYMWVTHRLFHIDPLQRPKSNVIIYHVFVYIFLGIIFMILYEVTKTPKYMIYGITMIMSIIITSAVMSFTRVMDFWQKPVETGQRDGDSMKKRARKKK